MSPARRRPSALIAVSIGIVSAAWLLVACGRSGGDSKGGQPTVASTGVSTNPTPTTGDVTQQVLVAYEAAIRAGERAGERADPADPELKKHYTGDGLRLIVQYLTTLKLGGLVTKGQSQLRPRIRSLDAGKAVIWDCLIDPGSERDAKTGEPRGSGPSVVGTESVLVMEDGTWKISGRTVQKAEVCAGS